MLSFSIQVCHERFSAKGKNKLHRVDHYDADPQHCYIAAQDHEYNTYSTSGYSVQFLPDLQFSLCNIP